MALDFPASPSNGQVHTSGGTSWSYDGNKWVVVAGQNIEPVYIASSTPAGVDGQIYWDSDESTAYIYYTDGDGTSQWVPLTSTGPSIFDAGAIVSGTLPIGRGGTGITDFDPQEMEADNGLLEIQDVGSGPFQPALLKYSSKSLGDPALVERVRITEYGAIGLAGANYGTDGQCLTSTGSSSTPEWRTPPLNNRNLVINGAMEINQRGTSTGGGYGGPDRWQSPLNMSGLVIEKSQQIDAPANTGLQKCYQLKTTTATSGSADNYVGVTSHLEFQDIHRAVWANNSHVTVSFWVKSSITGTFGFSFNPCNVAESTTDSNRRVLYHANYTISAANTWEYKTIVIDMATFNSSYTINSTNDAAQVEVGLQLTWPLDIISGGTRDDAALGWNDPATEARNFVATSAVADSGFSSTTNATWKITGIQFEVGSVATPFEHRSYSDELARCMRYYQKINGKTADQTMICPVTCHDVDPTGDDYRGVYTFPVKMRADPAMTFNDLLILRSSTDLTVIAGTSLDETTHSIGLDMDTASVAPDLNEMAILRLENQTTSYIDFSAEL